MGQLAAGHRYKVGIAKQSAEGTPAANPEFQIPIYGGGIKPVQQRGRHEVADGEAFRPGGFIQRADVQGSPLFAAFPNSLPRLITGHLASDTVSGGADPFSHLMKRADNAPWHTVWASRPKPDGSEHWDRFDDVLIKAVELQYAAGIPLRVMAQLIGKTGTLDVATPTPTTINKLDNNEPWYSAIGATLKLDLDATPAVTQVRNIESFTIRFGYDSMNLVQTDELTPRWRDTGQWGVGFSADILLDSYASYKAAFAGAASGSSLGLSPVIVRGSVDFLIDVGPTLNANRTLRIQIPAVEFTIDPPDPDVSGGAVKATLTAELQKPASGDPLSVTVKNAVAAAY
jgi:hypothetical protein